MATELGPKYLPTQRLKYPHMPEEDIPLWNEFLDKNQHLIQFVYYDVKVGGQQETEIILDEKQKKLLFYTTAKRIDALIEQPTQILIAEIDANPGPRAIGQLAIYTALWFMDPKIDKPAIPILIARKIDWEIHRAAAFYGMRTYTL